MNPLGREVYTVRSTVPPEWDAEFNEWQRKEHVPRLLSVPGYRGVQGYTRLDRSHSFMNVWQIDSKAAVGTEEWTRAARTPWSARIAPIRQDHSMDFYAPITGDGVAAGLVTDTSPGFLVRYDLWARAELTEAAANAEIAVVAKELAADRATSYIRTLKALDRPGEFLVLHYLTEKREPTAIESSSFERIESAPFASIAR